MGSGDIPVLLVSSWGSVVRVVVMGAVLGVKTTGEKLWVAVPPMST